MAVLKLNLHVVSGVIKIFDNHRDLQCLQSGLDNADKEGKNKLKKRGLVSLRYVFPRASNNEYARAW